MHEILDRLPLGVQDKRPWRIQQACHLLLVDKAFACAIGSSVPTNENVTGTRKSVSGQTALKAIVKLLVRHFAQGIGRVRIKRNEIINGFRIGTHAHRTAHHNGGGIRGLRHAAGILHHGIDACPAVEDIGRQTLTHLKRHFSSFQISLLCINHCRPSGHYVNAAKIAVESGFQRIEVDQDNFRSVTQRNILARVFPVKEQIIRSRRHKPRGFQSIVRFSFHGCPLLKRRKRSAFGDQRQSVGHATHCLPVKRDRNCCIVLCICGFNP